MIAMFYAALDGWLKICEKVFHKSSEHNEPCSQKASISQEGKKKPAQSPIQASEIIELSVQGSTLGIKSLFERRDGRPHRSLDLRLGDMGHLLSASLPTLLGWGNGRTGFVGQPLRVNLA